MIISKMFTSTLLLVAVGLGASDEVIETRVLEIPFPKGSGSGDPHFKTWTGEKFDYHGECDLVLLDHPTFHDGVGLRVHVRTTRVDYYSYIDTIAVQIGDETLEFHNNVQTFMLNGEVAPEQKPHIKLRIAGFHIRRDKKAISIRLDSSDQEHKTHTGQAKIDLIQRRTGFPAVVVEGGRSNTLQGSSGLLGEYGTGKRLARDGVTELKDATEFALEWQVRDTEPMIFKEARHPQYPVTCTPPAKMMGNRLGMSHMEKEAEKACEVWGDDKEDCIFDVIATRDVTLAAEGAVVA